MMEPFGGSGFILALRVLSQILYVSASIAVLCHVGIMQALARLCGTGLCFLLGTSRIDLFGRHHDLHRPERDHGGPRPFLLLLIGAELLAVMTSGAASTAGSIFAGYAVLGVPMTYLLAASLMAIPGGLLYAQILEPMSEPTCIATTCVEFGERRAASVIEAAVDDTQKGLRWRSAPC